MKPQYWLRASAMSLSVILGLVLSGCGSEGVNAQAQDAKPATEKAQTPKANITAQNLGAGFYLLLGPGGNIGVSTGSDGVFVIDDKFERFGEEIIATIKALSGEPVRYVLNTHYHGDHTGANSVMKTTGATVVAHDNVRARMGMSFENKVFGRTVEATVPELWPTLTYSEDATFYFNGQTVRAVHTPNAHTDGDTIVYFEEADILHMGDNYFNGLFPYIDVDGGGSVAGMITAHDRALAMISDQTQIIPGHGPMATKADLMKTRAMLQDIYDRVKARIEAGDDLDAILQARVLEDYASFASFINEENMVRITHRSITEG